MAFTHPRLRRSLPSNEYKRIFQAGNKLYSKGLVIYADKNDLNEPRLGMILRKKEIPLATQRNRIKRIIRESVRLNKETLGGIDIIVSATNKSLNYSNQDLLITLEYLWKQLLIRLGKR